MLSPEFVDINLAIAIHDDVIETFGGYPGLRDRGLLESALAQPKMSFCGQFLHPTISGQAAAYLYHISKNHAFMDGNKRTALGVMQAFLGMNDYKLDLDDNDLFDLVLSVSTDQKTKQELTEILNQFLVVVSHSSTLPPPSLEL